MYTFKHDSRCHIQYNMGNLFLDAILQMDDSILTYYKSNLSTFIFSLTKNAKNVGHKLFWWKKNHENIDCEVSTDIDIFKFPDSSEYNNNSTIVYSYYIDYESIIIF
jgi:hypothetical protein